MRTSTWILTAALLLTVSATAQQPAESQPSAGPAAAQTTAQSPSQAPAQETAASSAPAAAPATAAPAPAPTGEQAQAAPAQGQQGSAPPPTASTTPQPTTMDQVVDRFIEREHLLIKALSNRTPVVETYLQDLTADPQLGPVPSSDHYFLGRMDMGATVDRKDYLKEQEKGMEERLMGGFKKLYKVQYQPLGFSWMVYADRTDFDRSHYDFHYVRREFLGDVRCLVFDVTPKKNSGRGRFLGRVWVEDQEYSIVRLNGTYSPAPRNSYFFHMDSWRLNLIPGYWVPSYIYSEEGDFSAGVKNKIAFKAQTRIWGYDLKKGGKDDELTQIRVDSVKDDSPTAQDASPLQAEREWQQQAEDNVIERLTEAGLLAPEGDVDHILQTVVNNLEVTNNIDLPRPVRTRVLLTAPLETFSVGNTIVISRGLIDVLPDEASLAAVLSHELAHIVLGHNLGSKYAFNDRMLFSDDSTYNNLGFKHIPEEETAADKKAIDMLNNSPYAQKLDNVGLFLKALQARAPQLNALLTTHLGNPLAEAGAVSRLTALSSKGPALDNNKLDQVAALPLGGRIKINAWDDKAEMVKTAPVAITSARDKMPFEVTPFYPRLARYGAGQPNAQPTSAANSNPGN
ncbi:MAG TPA: M48 family metalloprotease [Candidatus Binatia bacterium]|nr:M48 family metalloprotease [Candidatus Binatia bacterium]